MLCDRIGTQAKMALDRRARISQCYPRARPSKSLSTSTKIRAIPVMIAVVDSEEKLAQASQAVEEMMEDGLIVFSDVDIVRLVHTHSLAEASEARS